MEDTLSVYLLIALLTVLVFQLYDLIITSVKLQIASVVSNFKFLYLRRYLNLYLFMLLQIATPSALIAHRFMKTSRYFVSVCQQLVTAFTSLGSLCVFVAVNRYRIPGISFVYLNFGLNGCTAPRYFLILLLA